MKRIGQLFLKGLFALLPTIVTFYILYWLGSLAESTLGAIIKWILPDRWYVPGMGIAAGLGVTIIMGILLQAYLFRQLANAIDRWLQQIPIIKTIYGSVRDIARFASAPEKDDLQKTVLLTLDNNVRLMGFITRKELELGNNKDMVAVYLPMSYQIGGYTAMVPLSRLEIIDNISSQDAMRFIVTAGMTFNDSPNVLIEEPEDTQPKPEAEPHPTT